MKNPKIPGLCELSDTHNVEYQQCNLTRRIWQGLIATSWPRGHAKTTSRPNGFNGLNHPLTSVPFLKYN
jgi:hypothetical protein